MNGSTVLAGALALALTFGSTVPVQGFVGFLNTAGQPRRWVLDPPDARVPATSVNRASRAIIYHLDAAGWSTTNAAAELDAIRAAFDQWQLASGGGLRFEEGALVSGTTDVNSQDGRNTLHWTRDLFVNGGRTSLVGLFALTFVASYSDGNVILDADTVFNGSQFRWFTDAARTEAPEVFVEAIALHEIGHFLGLRHSPVGGATMLAVGDLGVNSQVGLSADERAGLRALYRAPGGGAATGRLTGTVGAGGAGIFGAAVLAQDGAGNLASGTVSRSDGGYDLAGLLPGEYRVWVAPLDPFTAANYLVRGADIASPDYTGAQTQFLASESQVAVVAAGKDTALHLEVVGGNPLRWVRVLRPASNLLAPSFNNKPVSVRPTGQTVYLGGLTTAAGDSSMVLEVTGDGLDVGATEIRANALGSLTLVAAPVTVSPQATPGLRSLLLRRGGDVAWANGFVELLPPFPDDNGDGLDDAFQRRYWTRFTTPEAGPKEDPDDDGFVNDWEAATGTDPTDAGSAHFEVLAVRVTAEGARVISQAAAGKRFQLLARDNLPGSEWIEVGTPVLASKEEVEILDPEARRLRFYRLQLVP